MTELALMRLIWGLCGFFLLPLSPLSSFLTTPNLNSHMDVSSLFTAEMLHVHRCT